MDKGFFDRASPDFAARRSEARKLLDPAMQASTLPGDPLRQAWFEAVYALAEGDPCLGPILRRVRDASLGRGTCERDCGLKGSRCGLRSWRQCRMFCRSGRVRYGVRFRRRCGRLGEAAVSGNEGHLCAGRSLRLAGCLAAGFDLVHECYTLQALSPVLLPRTLAALGSLLAPGGKLLVVARERDEGDEIKWPPWLLPPSIFEEAKRQGLAILSIEDIPAAAGGASRHWRALLRRAEDA